MLGVEGSFVGYTRRGSPYRVLENERPIKRCLKGLAARYWLLAASSCSGGYCVIVHWSSLAGAYMLIMYVRSRLSDQRLWTLMDYQGIVTIPYLPFSASYHDDGRRLMFSSDQPEQTDYQHMSHKRRNPNRWVGFASPKFQSVKALA